MSCNLITDVSGPTGFVTGPTLVYTGTYIGPGPSVWILTQQHSNQVF